MGGDGRTVLVLGGARSGKSRYAEERAHTASGAKTYIATARPGDPEMAARIAAHRERRGADWTTVEEPYALAKAIRAVDGTDSFVLADCLTLWLTNLLLAERDIEAATGELLESLAAAKGMIVLVSNEVGMGIVPENALARRFRDAAGVMNQRVAEAADEVVLIAAGLPQILKTAG